MVMMNTAISINVAVSLGSRCPKRITPSGAARDPTTMVNPRISSAFEKIDPKIAVSATMVCPAPKAKSTTNNSGALPSVDCITPVTPGPKRVPTISVENPTSQATDASAPAQITNRTTPGRRRSGTRQRRRSAPRRAHHDSLARGQVGEAVIGPPRRALPAVRSA